jgi:transposase
VDLLGRIAELEAELARKDQELAERDARIERLERQVAELLDRLGRNSRNSNLPPSSDPPGARGGGGKGKKSKGKRRRGGQAGHRGSRRELLPVEQVDDVVDLFPEQCEHCCESLAKNPPPDPLARRYQVTELPAFEPHTTEYRRHAVATPWRPSTATRFPTRHSARD